MLTVRFSRTRSTDATALTDHSGWFIGEGGALTSAFLALVVLATRPLWRKAPRSIPPA